MDKEQRSKQGKRSRDRGARGERELVKVLKEYGYDVHRGFVFYGQSDIVGLPGIHPEVKRVEKLNIHKAMEQAKEEAQKRKDGTPTVFFRRDRGEWLTCMRLDDWIKLYEAWRKGNE